MKASYLEELRKLLESYQIEDSEKNDIISDYNDMYDGWINEGMTEEEVENKLGTPKSIIHDLMVGAKRKPSKAKKSEKYIAVTPFIALVIFFVLGFGFDLWTVSWMAFLIIPVTAIVLSMEDDREHVTTALSPFVAVIAYFILGFYYQLWHPGWLIFLLIPIIAIVNSRKEMSFLNLLVSLSPFAALITYIYLGEQGYYSEGWLVFMAVPMLGVLNEKSFARALLWEVLFVVAIVGYLYLFRTYGEWYFGAIAFIPLVVFGMLDGDVEVGFISAPKEYKIVIVTSLAIYVVLSYFFDLWGYAWIVFLSIPMYAITKETDDPEKVIALTPFIATILFMTIGYFFGAWAWAWIVYLIIPVTAIIKST